MSLRADCQRRHYNSQEHIETQRNKANKQHSIRLCLLGILYRVYFGLMPHILPKLLGFFYKHRNYLLPAKRNAQLIGHLQSAKLYPTCHARTAHFLKSFIPYSLANFQWLCLVLCNYYVSCRRCILCMHVLCNSSLFDCIISTNVSCKPYLLTWAQTQKNHLHATVRQCFKLSLIYRLQTLRLLCMCVIFLSRIANQ